MTINVEAMALLENHHLAISDSEKRVTSDAKSSRHIFENEQHIDLVAKQLPTKSLINRNLINSLWIPCCIFPSNIKKEKYLFIHSEEILKTS